MSDIIKITTFRELIEKERQRLIALKEKDPKWWESKRRSDWARCRFGKTLTELDGRTYFNHIKKQNILVNVHQCEICNRFPEIDEPFAVVVQGDEYEGYETNICINCWINTTVNLWRKSNDQET